MVVSVVSIPHTGTRFTLEAIRVLGFTTRHAHFQSKHPAQNAEEWLVGDPKVVVPWRDPEKVKESWANRGKTAPRFTPPDDAEFDRLLEYCDQPNVHQFTVDVHESDRDNELDALADFLETDVRSINWTPIGSIHTESQA